MSLRRADIVEVAKKTFARNGYSSTSMRDIAELNGVLAGSLYSHFRSKAEIVELAIMPFYQALIPAQLEALAEPCRGADQVESMLRKVVPIAGEHIEELTILHYDWSDLLRSDELSAVVEQSSLTLELWHRAIQRGVADGSVRPDVNAEFGVRFITSTIQGALDRRRFDPRADVTAAMGIAGLTDALATMVMRGLRAE